MKKFFKKYFGWLIESNRPKHLIAGFVIGGFLGFVPVIVAALTPSSKTGRGMVLKAILFSAGRPNMGLTGLMYSLR